MPNPTSKLNLVINGVTTQLDIHDANAVDLTNNQTVAGDKEFTGTTTAHDLVPSATDTYNFGSSTAQWNNAYIKSLTINGVACGDILTHNASEFVNVSSRQTIGGQKIFSHSQIGVGRDLFHFAINPYGKNTPPANTSFQYVWFSGNTASQGVTGSWYGSFIELVINTDGSARGSWIIRNTSDNRMGIHLSESADGSSSSIIPVGSAIDLGTSTNKWKSFNGINPGALSLPGTSVNIDTTNWVLDGSNVNIFTPTSDGWLGIQVTDTVYDQMHYIFVGRTGGGNTYYQQNTLSPINALWDNIYHGCVFIPVIKNVSYDIRCICNSIIATFYPCQGNV
jgi:hypothetical protein